MNKSEFLHRIAGEARGSLSPQLTQELLCEIMAHLDESIQARLELGEPPEIAELNAVAGFQSPESFVHRMEEVHEQSSASDKPVLSMGLVLIALIAFSTDLAFSGFDPVAFLLLVLGLVVAIFVRTCWLSSPKWATLKQLGVASVVLIGGLYPLLILNLWAYGGMGYIPARSVQTYIANRTADLNHKGRTTSSGAESYMPTWEDAGEIQQNIHAAVLARNAPILERYSTSAKVTLELIATTFGFILFCHLFPIAVRRRWKQLRGRFRRRLA